MRGVTATLIETDMPGLFDLRLADGRTFRDLTVRQCLYVAARDGLVLTGP
jgi:hypothetical protein